MSIAAIAPETSGEPAQEDLVPVGIYADVTAGFEHGLVVLAMGLPYWLIPAERDVVLLVERRVEDPVRAELARFDQESVGWPPPLAATSWTGPRGSLFSPLLWAFGLLMAFWLQLWFPRLTALGSLDAEAVFTRGDWWRPATALFLHGDAGHLVSNLLPGIFVFSTLLSTFGSRRGWLLLAISSLAANLVSAALHLPGPYQSVGASTAVFAGLGLLTGRAAINAFALAHARRWRGVFVPLAAGSILLALYGAGGPRVDLGAHLVGFIAGLVSGILAGANPIVSTRPEKA